MKDLDYAKLNRELETIVDQLQTADLDIDEAVKLYERGMKIIKDLEAYLKTAESKVSKIKASFEA